MEVTKFTGPATRDVLQNIEFGISQAAQSVTVKVQWPDQVGNSPAFTGVDLKASVPAGSPVQAVVGNGNITYRGTPGEGDYGFEIGNVKVQRSN